MREFVISGSVAGVSRLSLAVLSVLAGCGSPQFQLFQEEQEQYASMSGATTSGEVATTTTGDVEPTTTASVDSESGSTTDPADMTSTTAPSDATATGDATGTSDTADEPPVVDAEKPTIVSVELPAKVYAAGPVPLAVQTEHTGAVGIRLDGVDAGDLVAAGDGLFTGEVPVHGAIDNGSHEVEVIARLGPYEDRRSSFYEVATPAPGTEAWSMAGPTGSRTNRVAHTPAGDLIEVGQTEINGVPRPTIRQRSGVSGASPSRVR